MITDKEGKIFDDRRKAERRKENIKIGMERRSAERRTIKKEINKGQL